MQLNVSDLNINDSVAREQLLGHVQKTWGTFLDNGYERCDTTKGNSYCYSFWVPNENGKPKMLNQGERQYNSGTTTKASLHRIETRMFLHSLDPFMHYYLIFTSPEPSGSQGELIVYPCSGVRRRRCRCRQLFLNIFSSETAWPIKAKLYVEPPWEGGNENLYKWSRSHDQDGLHAHIW